MLFGAKLDVIYLDDRKVKRSLFSHAIDMSVEIKRMLPYAGNEYKTPFERKRRRLQIWSYQGCEHRSAQRIVERRRMRVKGNSKLVSLSDMRAWKIQSSISTSNLTRNTLEEHNIQKQIVWTKVYFLNKTIRELKNQGLGLHETEPVVRSLLDRTNLQIANTVNDKKQFDQKQCIN